MECLAGWSVTVKGQLMSMLSSFFQRKAGIVIDQSCSALWRSCVWQSPSYEICRADLPSVASMLAARPTELFHSEFYDSSTLGPGFEASVLQQLRPLEHFRACPVVLVGCSGHGKSQLIDALAVALGHAAVCARGATRSTQRHKLGAWGPNEEVVFVDTKGWQLGDEPTVDLRDSWQRTAVIVLVQQAEWVDRHLENGSFQAHLKALMLAARGKVLLPVLSRADRCEDTQMARQAFKLALDALNKDFGVELADVMLWKGESALEVRDKLREISKSLLESATTREKVLNCLDSALSRLPANSENALRRVWFLARQQGLRIKLPRDFACSDVAGALKQLRGANRELLPEKQEDWHRPKWRKRPVKDKDSRELGPAPQRSVRLR